MKNSLMFETEVETKVEKKTKEETAIQKAIILYNDDVNTFEFVIDCLIDICNHESTQAEQCAYLVHYKGKCPVKSGTYEVLKPLCSALLEKGLTAEIQ